MQRTLFRETTDPCANRHGGDPASRAAFDRIADALPDMRARVLQEIAAAGERGLTMKELAAQWRVQLNTISGRATELLALGLIVKGGERRGGAAVLKLAKVKDGCH